MLNVVDRYHALYNETTAADGVILGFPMEDDIYALTVDKLPRWAVRQNRELNEKTGEYEYSLKLVKHDTLNKRLLQAGAVKIAKVSDLRKDIKNRGDAFEELIYRLNGQVWKGHDSTPYYVKGDITINGKEYQVKYIEASVAKWSTIEEAKQVKGR